MILPAFFAQTPMHGNLFPSRRIFANPIDVPAAIRKQERSIRTQGLPMKCFGVWIINPRITAILVIERRDLNNHTRDEVTQMKKGMILLITCCLTHFLFAEDIGGSDATDARGNVYIADANPYESGGGFDIVVALTDTSEDEFNYLIESIGEKDAYALVGSHFDGDHASLLFHLQDLTRLGDLNRDIGNLEVLYDGDAENMRAFQLRRYVYQFDFAGGAVVHADARFKIQVPFDPGTPAVLGGYETRSTADGNAEFFGVGLRLDRAAEGIVSVVDELGYAVEVDLGDDGKWYIRTSGIVSGEEVSKSIEFEVIQ